MRKTILDEKLKIKTQKKKSNMKNQSMFLFLSCHSNYSVLTFDFESLKFVLNTVAVHSTRSIIKKKRRTELKDSEWIETWNNLE